MHIPVLLILATLSYDFGIKHTCIAIIFNDMVYYVQEGDVELVCSYGSVCGDLAFLMIVCCHSNTLLLLLQLFLW